jgi:uncharacterized Zn finger protein
MLAMSWYRDFKPYVPVAKRRAQAAKYASGLAKKEKRTLSPIKIDGRKIANSFWGQAWCDNLERYSDFANRLPRGRTYVRNGSVVDLQIDVGEVRALVSGSDVYRVKITIDTLPKAAWTRIKQDCSQSIDSLIDLLQGRFDQGIMQRLTQRDGGLFPPPKEIKMSCSCPDWAGMCKHVAAVLYGVGARLDAAPELLFTLRKVDHLELVSQAVAADNLDKTLAAGQTDTLAGSDLGELFGIELDAAPATTDVQPAARRKRAKAQPVTPQAEPDKPTAKAVKPKRQPASRKSAAKRSKRMPDSL